MDRPTFSLGIEEEYLVVDRETRDLVSEPGEGFFEACREAIGDQVTPEFLQCQVEVGTKPHRTVADAIADLAALRRGVSQAAEAHGYAMIAASTHPFATWRRQSHTRKERYDGLWSDLGATAWRMLICGMHMHIGIEDEDQRIDLMNQAAYFLPHLLALSGSSPFWEGQDTSLASYRLTVFDALPRTGLPDQVASYSEYRRLVNHLIDAGCVEDATKIWWDIRPSDRYPTLEQRVTDVCPRIDDIAALAAAYQSIMAYLFRLRTRNQRWRIYPATLVRENRWRAQRYGVEGKMVDHGRSRLVPVGELIDELVEILAEDAEALGCRRELEGLRRIVREGTSAMRQRRAYAEAVERGEDAAGALRAVVDQLIGEFVGDGA